MINVDTVPPPAGERDAYSAKTRVATLPEEVLAAMRDPKREAPVPPRTRSGTRRMVPRPPPLPTGAGMGVGAAGAVSAPGAPRDEDEAEAEATAAEQANASIAATRAMPAGLAEAVLARATPTPGSSLPIMDAYAPSELPPPSSSHRVLSSAPPLSGMPIARSSPAYAFLPMHLPDANAPIAPPAGATRASIVRSLLVIAVFAALGAALAFAILSVGIP